MNKKTIRICGLTALVLLSLLLFLGNRGFVDVYRTYNEITIQSQQIQRARSTLDSLKEQYELLKQDTTHIEKLAREKLGMAGENEKIIKFVEEER